MAGKQRVGHWHCAPKCVRKHRSPEAKCPEHADFTPRTFTVYEDDESWEITPYPRHCYGQTYGEC